MGLYGGYRQALSRSSSEDWEPAKLNALLTWCLPKLASQALVSAK
jgi:hypothetical protein